MEERSYLSSPARKAVEPHEYQMLWITNQLCNFQCVYCSADPDLFLKGCPTTKREVARQESPEVGKYSAEHIAKCFDDSGKIWRIHLMGGGETFLYPQFLELAKALTQKHYIAITTNLSTPNVYQFADVIWPDRVLHITASLHVMEREKRKNGVEEFIRKMLYLQNKGFNVSVHHVTYPPLFPRLLKDVHYFKAQGIENFYLRPFQGVYGERLYPESYTNEEKALINSCTMDAREVDMMTINAFGRICYTGYNSFGMDHAGNLSRCMSSSKKYGNFFTGRYHFDESPRPCPVRLCRCPLLYEGYIKAHKGSLFSILREMLVECNYRYPVHRPLVAAGQAKRNMVGTIRAIGRSWPNKGSKPAAPT